MLNATPFAKQYADEARHFFALARRARNEGWYLFIGPLLRAARSNLLRFQITRDNKPLPLP